MGKEEMICEVSAPKQGEEGVDVGEEMNSGGDRKLAACRWQIGKQIGTTRGRCLTFGKVVYKYGKKKIRMALANVKSELEASL